jgi:ribonuclease HI
VKLHLNTDGGSAKTNPGEAAIGFVIRDEDENIVAQAGECIGWASNNEAEYSALIAGLYNCHLLGAKRVLVRADSQLMVRQMEGHWAVRHDSLKRYHREASAEVGRFEHVEFQWVPRAKNAEADRLANIALGKVKA